MILSICPRARVVDVTHGVPPQDVRAGALILRQVVPYFPPGTIHVAVVDPGVGGKRRPVAVETDRAWLVGPDNGLLSLAAPPQSVRKVIHLTARRFFRHPVSRTFHGRDIFAPVAAHLAAGVDPTALGRSVRGLARAPVGRPTRRGRQLQGEVVYVDRFGNLVTNIGEDDLRGFPRTGLSVSIGGACLRGLAGTYASARRGRLLALIDSWGLLEIAVREGSAAQVLGAGVGTPVTVAMPGS